MHGTLGNGGKIMANRFPLNFNPNLGTLATLSRRPHPLLMPPAKVDTCRADASLDPEGKSLELNLDVSSILNAPSSPLSRWTRGFPSEYHPAQEHIRQGIEEASWGWA
jgi:hypothetical protein